MLRSASAGPVWPCAHSASARRRRSSSLRMMATGEVWVGQMSSRESGGVGQSPHGSAQRRQHDNSHERPTCALTPGLSTDTRRRPGLPNVAPLAPQRASFGARAAFAQRAGSPHRHLPILDSATCKRAQPSHVPRVRRRTACRDKAHYRASALQLPCARLIDEAAQPTTPDQERSCDHIHDGSH